MYLEAKIISPIKRMRNVIMMPLVLWQLVPWGDPPYLFSVIIFSFFLFYQSFIHSSLTVWWKCVINNNRAQRVAGWQLFLLCCWFKWLPSWFLCSLLAILVTIIFFSPTSISSLNFWNNIVELTAEAEAIHNCVMKQTMVSLLFTLLVEIINTLLRFLFL